MLSKTLRKIRELMDVTTYDMAKLIGATQGSIANWENNWQTPRSKYLDKYESIAVKNKLRVSLKPIRDLKKTREKLLRSREILPK